MISQRIFKLLFFLVLPVGMALLILANVSFAAENVSLSLKLPKPMEKATYVGMETCVTCHEEKGKEFKLTTHARISNDKVEGVPQACEMCHGPGSAHVDNGGGKGNDDIINPRKNPEICFSCHLDKKTQFRLPYRHPVLEGKMSCSDCHDLHGSEAKPWTTTKMEGVNEACFKCHQDQEGPFVYEHAAMREGCATCHKVHGSINNKMLVAKDANLCLRCHGQSDYPNMGLPAGTHTNRLGRATCWSGGCHEHPHGSNFSNIFFYE